MEAVTPALPWAALLALGAVHGVNPAMGWLFAVALGLQEEDRLRVWSALGPLALGHALAVGAAVAAAVLLGRLVPLEALRWAVAATLLAFGVAHLVRHRHPARGGMKVDWKDLTLWSFLMASAHGAGLMVVPFVLDATVDGAPGGPASTAGGASPIAGLPPEPLAGLAATALHTGAYLFVTGLVAVLVYEKLGLRLLRSAWINLDLLWAGALIATAVLTPFL
jgi:hypothetical protein